MDLTKVFKKTINLKQKGGVHGRDWKEESKGENDVITVSSKVEDKRLEE